MKPIKGLCFYHSRVINADGKPMIYVITKIARGMVYYRPFFERGGPDCCPVEQFPRWVKEIFVQ